MKPDRFVADMDADGCYEFEITGFRGSDGWTIVWSWESEWSGVHSDYGAVGDLPAALEAIRAGVSAAHDEVER